MENPFKFGTLVEGEYFTGRVDEVRYICQLINSANHLVLISPRRFGKSSVVAKAIKESRRKSHGFLSQGLGSSFPNQSDELTTQILNYTSCHPYYTQQLASNVWQMGALHTATDNPIQAAVDFIVTTHVLDYERLWVNLNRTNKWILQRLASNQPLQNGEYPTSTIYSALKRLQRDGYVIYSDRYEIEDPFFSEWILRMM